jgi:hypothetical protein
MNKHPEFIIHRINEVSKLKSIPSEFGCEIDIRSNGSKLILNHNPYLSGDNLIDFLDNYQHGTLVLNIKESGIENDILSLVRERKIESFFLLDVEFPYLYKSSRKGERSIAVRYSEDEPLDLVAKYSNKVDWVWIDTITKLPINKKVINTFINMKTCLVCPERWGRPNDIMKYKKHMNSLNFSPDAIMTSIECINSWNK